MGKLERLKQRCDRIDPAMELDYSGKNVGD